MTVIHQQAQIFQAAENHPWALIVRQPRWMGMAARVCGYCYRFTLSSNNTQKSVVTRTRHGTNHRQTINATNLKNVMTIHNKHYRETHCVDSSRNLAKEKMVCLHTELGTWRNRWLANTSITPPDIGWVWRRRWRAAAVLRHHLPAATPSTPAAPAPVTGTTSPATSAAATPIYTWPM